ncbi:hypothetical protein [Tistlia consotensis]|nr:hypothetical protein [Tistlia consotensis]
MIIAAIVIAGVGYQMAKAAEHGDRLEFLTAIATARTNLAQLKQAAAPAALNLDVDQMIALGVLPSSLADLARDSVGLATAWGSIGLDVSNSSMQLSLDSLTREQCFWMARGLKAGATLSARGLDLAGHQPTVQETFEACGRQPILVWKL